jgi:hypothetical protein
MCSQPKGIGSANISASMCGKIRTIPTLLHRACTGRIIEAPIASTCYLLDLLEAGRLSIRLSALIFVRSDS